MGLLIPDELCLEPFPEIKSYVINIVEYAQISDCSDQRTAFTYGGKNEMRIIG